MSERSGNTFLLAAALSLAGFALAAIIEVAPSFARAAHSVPSMQRSIDRTFDLGGIRLLRVRGTSSDIDVARSERTDLGFRTDAEPASNVLAVHGMLGSFDARALSQFSITYVRDGDVATLTLVEPDDAKYIHNTFSLALSPSRSLDVVSASGDVTIEGPGAPATAHTDSGDLVVSDAAASLDLQTTSGDIAVTRPGGRVAARTSSGEVKVRAAKGALSLGTSSGDIVAVLDRAWSGNAIAIESSSGDVELRVPPGLRASLTTMTGSGDVSNGAGLPSNAPGAPTISLQTSSGDVKVAELR